MTADWNAACGAFLDELRHVRRLSPLTVSAYRHELTLLAQAFPDGPMAPTAPALRRELARAHAGGLSGRSIARRVSAWRTFFDWLGRHAGLPANPAKSLRVPRSPHRLPAVLGVEAASRLVQPEPQASSRLPASKGTGVAADDPAIPASPAMTGPAASGAADDPWQIQDDALFELLYSSGLRLAELVGLDLDRLDLGQGLVTVLGKGQRTRTIPVGAAACLALRRWLAIRDGIPAAAEERKAVFLGRRGGRLSPRTVQDHLARRGRALGLPQNVHPHMLRHSCASHVLQSSADLRSVQELLGHASIASTQIYTHLDFQHLALAYDAAHPRARAMPSGDAHDEIPPAGPIGPAGQ